MEKEGFVGTAFLPGEEGGEGLSSPLRRRSRTVRVTRKSSKFFFFHGLNAVETLMGGLYILSKSASEEDLGGWQVHDRMYYDLFGKWESTRSGGDPKAGEKRRAGN